MKKLKAYKTKCYHAEISSLYRSESEIMEKNLMKIAKKLGVRPDKLLYLLDIPNMKYLIVSNSLINGDIIIQEGTFKNCLKVQEYI